MVVIEIVMVKVRRANLTFQGTDPYVLSTSSMRYLVSYAKMALVGRKRGVLPRVAAVLPGRSVGGAG